MSHFLSDATHDRLFHRQEPVTISQSRAASQIQQSDNASQQQQQQQSSITGLAPFRAPSSAPSGAVTVDITGPGAGLFKSQAFEGPIRSAAVTQTVKHGHAPVVWCGDTEGTLSLRNSATGEVRVLLEQREKNVYAYAIVFVPNDDAGGNIWVGFSDGYLCVLDADTGAKKFETRAHGGSIYAMEYHAITNRVYTCGADWQITAWNAEKMCRAPAPSQLSGHQNGVRSLCFGVGGNTMILYSGADDYTIRAWDVTKHQELSNNWPAVGHKGGVHNLACTGQLLFSGSTDGTVRVWLAAFGDPIRVIDTRGPGMAINSLTFDEANNCVWAGGIDGVINIWDATDLSLRADLTEHHATHVTMIKPVSRLAACKVWSLTKDGIHVHYIDTDGAVGGGDAIENTRLAEIECINDVDRRRRKVIECDIELNDLRQEGERMQERERMLKSHTVDALHHGHNRSLQQQYINQIWQFVDKRRRLRIATAEANMLATRNNNMLMRRYWAKWTNLQTEAATKRQEDEAVKAIEDMEAERLRAEYAQVVLEAARRKKTQLTQEAAANALAARNEAVTRQRVLRLWSTCSTANKWTRREKRGREQIAAATGGHYQRASTAWAWYKLNQQTHALNTRKCAQAHASMLGDIRTQDLRRRYFDMWMSCTHNSIREMTNLKLSNLQRGVENEREELREKAAKSAKAELAKLKSTTAAHEAHMKELNELRENIKAVDGVSESELNNAIAEKEKEVASIQMATRKEQIVLEELRKEMRAIQRELMRDASLDMSKPVLQQLNQAIYLLKARGVNVMKDHVAIAAAREAAAKKTPAGAGDKVYQAGLNQIKECFQDAIGKSNPLTEYDAPLHWLVRGAIDKFHEKQMVKAAHGLATMVTAYDVMTVGSKGDGWVHPDPKAPASAEEKKDVFKPEFKHHEEVILNFGPLLDLAIRVFKWRRGEIELAEAPASPTASPSPVRSPAGKKAGAKSASPKRSATSAPRSTAKPAAKTPGKTTTARATSASPSSSPTAAKKAPQKPAATSKTAAGVKKPAAKPAATTSRTKAPAAKPTAKSPARTTSATKTKTTAPKSSTKPVAKK